MIISSIQIDERSLAEICRQNDVSKLSVFGSFARGEDTATSDIDLIVEFDKEKGLLELIALERQLSEMLGRRVDLLTEQSISPYIRDFVGRDKKVLFDATR